MTETPPTGGTVVRLPGSEPVPPCFTVRLNGIRHGETFDIQVQMVGGRPHIDELRIRAGDREGPINPERLREIGTELIGVLDAAVREAVLNSPSRQRYTLEEIHEMGAEAFHDVIRSSHDNAMAAARAARRRRITPELLTQVVELYNRDGVGLIMKELDCSERTARRWLARAREAGLR